MDVIRRMALISKSRGLNAVVMVMLLLWIWRLITLGSFPVAVASTEPPLPTPRPWPHQFHSILLANYSGSLSLIDLWYDWPNGRNFNIIRNQLQDSSSILYDLEWNNGTSFFYTLDQDPSSSLSSCRSAQLEVGILRPNWLDGATYLGQRSVDGFLCNVWEKADFLWYYEDVITKRPVHWVFYTGRSIHVMTYEVGAVLDDSKWQAPVYCFEKKDEETDTRESILDADILEHRGCFYIIGYGHTNASSQNEAHYSGPLPFDADQLYSCLHRDGLVSRCEKSVTHFHEDLLPLRRNISSSTVELLCSGKKWDGVDSTEDSKLGHSESSGKEQQVKVSHGVLYIEPSSDEDDFCPTCLEEYTEENRKITTKCSNHFHLGCIYEWMERSDSCPICGKEMEFCESP